MKKMGVIIVVLVLVLLLIGGGCIYWIKNHQNGVTKKTEITNFEYLHFSYSTGNMIYSNVRYSIDLKEGKYIATIKPNDVPDEEAKEVEINEETIKQIIEVLNEYDVLSWDKFNKSDKNVLDGDSFSFNMKLDDKQSISASGYMEWPKNYGNVKGELDDILKKLYEE